MSDRKPRTPNPRTPPPPRPANPATASQDRAAADLRRAARFAEQARRDAEGCAKLASLPFRQAHAAGIDVGDATHWACVDSTRTGPTRSASSRPTPPGCGSSSGG